MLDLNDLRAAFAAHLSADPLRFSMDKALAHVCQIAYQRGLEDGAAGLGIKADERTAAETMAKAIRKGCAKCGGEGWLRGDELDCADEDTRDDTMTKYGCDGDVCTAIRNAELGGLDDGAMGAACLHCGGSLRPGIAIAQTATGAPDFPRCEAVTMSPGGPGRIIDCIKCAACGWSISKAEEQKV